MTSEIEAVEEAAPTSEETVKKEVEVDEEESAARFFHYMMPTFRNMVKSSESKGTLVRVLTALAEFPLGDKKPRFLDEKEKMLFDMFIQLSGAKQVLMEMVLKKRLLTKQGEKVDGDTRKEVSEGLAEDRITSQE